MSNIPNKRRKKIIQCALDVYIKRNYHNSQWNEKSYRVSIDKEFSAIIEDTILDNGMMYMTDMQDYLEWWFGLVQKHKDKKDTFQYIMLDMARQFRILGFESADEYSAWVDFLAKGIASMSCDVNGDALHTQGTEKNPSYVLLEDEMLEKMISYQEIKNILSSNPWVVFLNTLAINSSELLQMSMEVMTVTEIARILKENNGDK